MKEHSLVTHFPADQREEMKLHPDEEMQYEKESVELQTVGNRGAISTVRIRGENDMVYLRRSIRALYTTDYKLAVKLWEEEPKPNAADCPYHDQVKGQRTPCGVNKYILLGFFLVVVFLRGCTYWGWNGMQDMLYKSGAYSWKCETATGYQRVGDNLYIDCPQRKNAINDLYTAALACNFIFSAVGGIILDAVGPKCTFLGAVLVDAIGWALLAGASENFQSYIPAMVFIGMAADPGYLPMICLANMFPSHESTVMGMMGSVRSLSFAMPVIMAEIFKSKSFADSCMWQVVLGYIIIGLGLSLLIGVIFVPLRPFKGAEDFRSTQRKQHIVQLRNNRLSSLDSSFFQYWATDFGVHSTETYRLSLTRNQYLEVVKVFDEVEKEDANSGQEETIWSVIRDPRFLLIIPVFVFNLLRVEFYTKSNKEQMVVSSGEDLYVMFSVFNILSFVPGPAVGYGIDRFGILSILGFLNIAGIGMYALLMPDSLGSKGLSILCFWLYASFVLSSIYCYIKIHFPNNLFGTLAGVVSLIGGVFALTSVGWYKLSSETLISWYPRNFWLVDGLMIVAGLIVCVLILIMFCLEKKAKQKQRDCIQLKQEAITMSEQDMPETPFAGVSVDNHDKAVGGGYIHVED